MWLENNFAVFIAYYQPYVQHLILKVKYLC